MINDVYDTDFSEPAEVFPPTDSALGDGEEQGAFGCSWVPVGVTVACAVTFMLWPKALVVFITRLSLECPGG